MKTVLIIISLLLSITYVTAQKKQNYFPAWTFHQSNINIHGISLGVIAEMLPVENTRTNGIRVELIGLGLFTFMIPSAKLPDNDSLYNTVRMSEYINGLNLSLSGTASDCYVNGASLGYCGEILHQVNGVSATTINNMVIIHNGLQLAVFVTINHRCNGLQLGAFNFSNHTKGMQIGVINRSKDLRGFQLGLWNKNAKRSLPLINWQLKKADEKRLNS